jgi:hypothetical protein
MSSSLANPIDLSISDDEEEKTQKKRKPEVTCGCDQLAKCYLHFNYDEQEKKSLKEADKCGCCDEVRESLKKTGNSIGFVCEDCEENNPEMAFCDGCDRYEETNDINLCGRCQHGMWEEMRRADDREERAFARRIGAVCDTSSDDDEN